MNGRAVTRDELRSAMARTAAGVVVVTARGSDGTPQGLTATSFCSVSLEPALVLVCVAETAGAYKALAGCEEFAVSVLRHEQSAVATRFATSGAEKFHPADTELTPRDLPAVAGALCQLDCVVDARHPAGDHLILVGEVTAVRLADGGDPLVYAGRSYRTLSS
ncbi:flavin reductase family protein [Kitasatospora sp. NPDC057595]|uniref:flavin reductase family protein n=2 Tax=unclassified Kitasatospora TaxID=2633591 RepID=UPI00369AE315